MVDHSSDYDPALMDLILAMDEEDIMSVIADLPGAVVEQLLQAQGGSSGVSLETIPSSPLSLAKLIDDKYVDRIHLQYLDERLANAVRDVEAGKDRKIMVSMPPRSGKSRLSSVFLPAWLITRHPDWKIGLISHNPTLSVSWGRAVRKLLEEEGHRWGVFLAKDAGAASDWETVERGEMRSRSAPGQSLTGLGFKVMIIDDPVKDYATAHSSTARNSLWDWWLANAFTRLEPPSLTVVIGTRWHEDDLLGRLVSSEHEGNPEEWEIIKLPAIAEEFDVLGRAPGDPLYLPLVSETRDEALARWAKLKATVGSYTWSALYQQRPSPPEGTIFSSNWWRFWTTDVELASPLLADGSVDPNAKTIYLDPGTLGSGIWVDSWDTSFKGEENSDFVVGQRWVRYGANRFLVVQQRGRWGFTASIANMKMWGKTDDPAVSPWGQFVHRRLIEDSANGPAIIEKLREEISGIKPVRARASKEARARAVSPEIESGNVFLPHPSMPGYGWVNDLLDEFRDFPSGANDDQVDAMTQALTELRGFGSGGGSIMLPGQTTAATSEELRSGKVGTVAPVGVPVFPGGGRVSSGALRVNAAKSMRPRV